MIRKAFNSERRFLFSLVNTAYEVEIGSTGVAFKTTPRYDFDVDSELMSKEIEDLYVYTDNDITLGCAKAVVNSGIVHIGPIAVTQGKQKQGIGSALLDYVEKLAPIAEISVVSCRTDVLPFYSRRGYKLVKEEPIENLMSPETFTSGLTREGLNVLLYQKAVTSVQ